jgi:hypothetical protein
VRLRQLEFSFCSFWKMMSETDYIQGRLQRQHTLVAKRAVDLARAVTGRANPDTNSPMIPANASRGRWREIFSMVGSQSKDW